MEQEKALNDQLNELENLFSDLIIELNEIDEIEIEEEKDINPNNNISDKGKIKRI